MIRQFKFPKLTSDEVLAFAHRHRTFGVHERKWTFAKSPEGGHTLFPLGGPRYLFRGQTKRYTPCFPRLYRHLKAPARFLCSTSKDDTARIIADIVRTFWYYSELDRHPIFQWAKTEKLHLPLLELAQHYGIPTPLIDLTESIEVALFFATHEVKDGAFQPSISGGGILYIIDRTTMPREIAARFTPVAIQPFARPFRQLAWTCELLMGECFEAYPLLGGFEFEHSESLANEIRPMAEAEGDLYPPDFLAELATNINRVNVFPKSCIEAATRHLGRAFPEDLFGTVRDTLEETGYASAEDTVPLLSEMQAKRMQPTCKASIDSWKASALDQVVPLYVRGGRDTGKPLEYGILTPPATEGGEWSIVASDRYVSAWD